MRSAAASSVLASMAALQGAREATGDFTMTCRGATLKAHAHVLSMGSEFFEGSMGFPGDLDFKDCEPATLATTIDFLYGVDVPEGFQDLQGLLRLADKLIMEALKKEVVRRLARGLTEENILETSALAEAHEVEELVAACGTFLVYMGVEMDAADVERVPRVAAAALSLAMQELQGRQRKRGDFQIGGDYAANAAYAAYAAACVRSVVRVGTRVRCILAYGGVKEGEKGVVSDFGPDGETIVQWDREVSGDWWEVREEYIPAENLELVEPETGPLHH